MPGYTLIPGEFPENILKTTDGNYVAADGWNIERRGDKYVLCFTDPGHGGQQVEMEVKKTVDDYARECQPTWSEVMRYIKIGK